MGENDRELLELAAKAAGVVGEFQHFGIYVSPERTADNNCYWNPLQSDGDALRLAVKLGFAISIDQVELMTYASHDEAWKGCIEKWYCHPTSKDGSQDQYAATRRAIVRAAAEIGKAMP